MRLSEAIKKYLKNAQLRPETIEQYNRSLGWFIAFTNDAKIDDLKPVDILNFRTHLKYSPQVNHNAVQSVKSLFKFLNIYYDLGFDYRKIEPPKVPLGHWGYLTDQQLTKLFKSFGNSMVDTRDLAICKVLFSTACRSSELLRMQRDDIDFDKKEVTIIGAKTGKKRKVYLTNDCLRAIKKYLATRRDNLPILWATCPPGGKNPDAHFFEFC